MKLIQIESDQNNNVMAKEPLLFFTTQIGNSKYASLFEPAAPDRTKFATWKKRNITEYLLIKYQIEQGRLSVWLPDSSEAAALVRSGKLKGDVVERGLLKDLLRLVTINDSAILSRFLGDGGDKVLFPDSGKLVFSRVR
jgi:hypothetical protein